MPAPLFASLGDGLYCIDTLYTAQQIACCYLIRDGDECALIETGTARSVANILGTLEALSISPGQLRYVVPTHVHLDHAGGAGALMRLFPNAELLIHPRGARHMLDPARLVQSSIQVYGEEVFERLYGEIVPVEASRLRVMEDGDSFSVGERCLEVHHTRGHADHHFCLYDARTSGWFSGDMFGISYARQRFAPGSFLMPATTPTQFSPELYADSVRRLAARKPRWIYLTHYGALAYRTEQLERLLRQLSAYADLAQAFNGDLEDLQKDLRAVTVRELEPLIEPNRLSAEIQALAMDMQLNAQGIAWLSQSKSAP